MENTLKLLLVAKTNLVAAVGSADVAADSRLTGGTR